MTRENITQGAIDLAKETLKIHYNYSISKKDGTETQKAYYEGMKQILEILFTDGFSRGCLVVDCFGNCELAPMKWAGEYVNENGEIIREVTA